MVSGGRTATGMLGLLRFPLPLVASALLAPAALGGLGGGAPVLLEALDGRDIDEDGGEVIPLGGVDVAVFLENDLKDDVVLGSGEAKLKPSPTTMGPATRVIGSFSSPMFGVTMIPEEDPEDGRGRKTGRFLGEVRPDASVGEVWGG